MNKMAIRSEVRAPKGYYLLQTDLSQAEAWIVAALSHDQNMMEALKRGDIHSLTAITSVYQKQVPSNEDIHNFCKRAVKDGILTDQQRHIGKKCNHAYNYRMKAEEAASNINKEGGVTVSVTQTRLWYNKYHEFYNVKTWWSRIEEQLGIDRTLTSCYGRKRTFYEQWGNDLFKPATSWEPQHTVAFHMYGATQREVGIKGGMLEVFNQIVKLSNGEIKINNTAHDSMILEVPIGIINEIAERVVGLIRRPLVVKGHEFVIPVDASYSEYWKEGEVKIKI